ncbi:C4-dicarboxylate transporter DctA [Pseudomonas helleri]|uniref:C4-dicarboxylate transporter DctA n=1 Tax=Pseudomonas helleri TaxID=1608996 RepID=UPI0036F2E754
MLRRDPVKILKNLYVQVIIGLIAGILLGYFWPSLGVEMKPLGDTFIRLIKMLITLVIFCTVAIGIARMESLKELGKVGFKTLVYFEVVTSVALLLGMIIANLVQPGAGMNIDPATLDTGAMSQYLNEVHAQESSSLLTQLVPNSVVGAFASGNLLQVLLFSVLFGVALSGMSRRSKLAARVIEQVGETLMRIVGMIMWLAPIGAFGAMAFTIGKYGIGALQQMGMLIVCLYVSCLLFVTLVLGSISFACGVNIWSLIKYFREELLIVLGTSTTESVLPRLMDKMERLGCDKSIVGLVLPTGYSFNLDGAAIYLTMSSLFLAQALNIDLSWTQQLSLLVILLITSKGGAGVAGAALIVLTATLASHDIIPVAAITLILGIDRILNEVRALTNMMGNIVGTMAIARWEGKLDLAKTRAELASPNHLKTNPSSETKPSRAL